MNSIYNIVKKYIEEICENNKIPIDLRIAAEADSYEFVQDNGLVASIFWVEIDTYYIKDLDELKSLILNTYLVRLSQHRKNNQRIALYIKYIENVLNGYVIEIGGKLFYDKSYFN